MPEKHDLLAAILMAKEQGIGAILCLQWRTSRRYNGGVYKNSNRRNDVRHYRPVHSWPSRLRRTKANRLYNERVIIGIGTDSIGSLIKRFAAKKVYRRW